MSQVGRLDVALSEFRLGGLAIYPLAIGIARKRLASQLCGFAAVTIACGTAPERPYDGRTRLRERDDRPRRLRQGRAGRNRQKQTAD